VIATLNLRTLRLRSGEQYRDRHEIPLEPFELAGQRYLPVPDTAAAEVAVTKASSGTVFELAFPVRLHGPCFRCLEDASLGLRVRSREYQATDPEGVEELTTPYIHDDRLDLAEWARDAVADMLPEQILCREDCAGLCPVCGRNLNAEPHEHEAETGDARWDALAELRERL
jgi:DUF177 domain-containing protein